MEVALTAALDGSRKNGVVSLDARHGLRKKIQILESDELMLDDVRIAVVHQHAITADFTSSATSSDSHGNSCVKR